MFDMPSKKGFKIVLKKHRIKIIQLLFIYFFFLITNNITALVNFDKTIRPGTSDTELSWAGPNSN